MCVYTVVDEPKIIDVLKNSYVEAMKKQDEISSALAADAVAFQRGLGEFSSTAEEWDGLDSAVAYVEEVGGEVSESTRTAFQDAERAAKECGVKIPDTLSGIAGKVSVGHGKLLIVSSISE